MADDTDKKARSSMTGSVAANLHEGSRSEYLAQFVFSSFGTAIPVPHQEDTGLDLYCSLLERMGQRAWPRAYYAVQVKSIMEPWVFNGSESVRWIIEHPLPIFLCVVEKPAAIIRVYHTTPRFAAWALPTHSSRLELIPGDETRARTADWAAGNTFKLEAPILKFSIQEILDYDFRVRIAEILKFWIDYDAENLFRIKSGIPYFWVPADYETNSTKFTAWTGQGGRFREETLALALKRLNELLGLIARHYHGNNDMVSAAIYAMALRHMSPDGYAGPHDAHDHHLHSALNKCFAMDPPSYVFQACDSLLNLVRDELVRHGITGALPSALESE